MLPQTTLEALAQELYHARKARTPLRHFSARHPEMTIADGYAIQREWVKLEPNASTETIFVYRKVYIKTDRHLQFIFSN